MNGSSLHRVLQLQQLLLTKIEGLGVPDLGIVDGKRAQDALQRRDAAAGLKEWVACMHNDESSEALSARGSLR